MSVPLPRVRPGSFPLLAALATLIVAAWPAAGLSQAIDTCRASVAEYRSLAAEPTGDGTCALDPDYLGIDHICPEHTEALLAHPWAPLLARDRGDLQLADLEGFYALYRDYRSRAPVAAPAIAGVGEALAQLAPAPAETLSFWQRVWRWFAAWWEERDRPDSDWLEAISVPETAVQAVLYGSVALIVLLAAGIVTAELRAAGRSRRRIVKTGWRDGGPGAASSPGLAQVREAPLREQPGLLLRLLLSRLLEAGVLQVAAGATHRDIVAAADGLADAAGIGRLCAAAENATYGDWQPDRADVSALHELCARVTATLAGGGPTGVARADTGSAGSPRE